jgi:hypothetical protein
VCFASFACHVARLILSRATVFFSFFLGVNFPSLFIHYPFLPCKLTTNPKVLFSTVLTELTTDIYLMYMDGWTLLEPSRDDVKDKDKETR